MKRLWPIFALAAAPLAPAQTVTVSPSPIPAVDLIGPQSPDYWTVVEQLFATRSGALNAWLPYGIILKNGASQTIVATAILWDVTTGQGFKTGADLSEEAFNLPKSQIPAGQSVVVVPHYGLLNAQRLPQALSLTPRPGYAPSEDRMLPQYETAQSIHIELQGVVFASGQFVGPDTGKEYERMEADVTGPPQVAAKVLAMQAAREPTANVLAWLQTASASEHSQDLTTRVMGRTARQLLQTCQLRGEQAMYQAAQSRSKPVIQLYR